MTGITAHDHACFTYTVHHDHLYNVAFPDRCDVCDGTGTVLVSQQYQGYEPCVHCYDQGICPQCGQDMDYHDAEDEGCYWCPSCGWSYDSYTENDPFNELYVYPVPYYGMFSDVYCMYAHITQDGVPILYHMLKYAMEAGYRIGYGYALSQLHK